MDTGNYIKTRLDLDIDMEESGSEGKTVFSSRALFTSCYDGVNNIIWSYLPFSKKMRALENVGLPQQVEDASIGYIESKHPEYLLRGDSKQLTAHQTVVSFLSNALRFTTKNRPCLEEIGLPTLEKGGKTEAGDWPSLCNPLPLHLLTLLRYWNIFPKLI